MKAIIVMGDVVESRKKEPRRLQRQLKESLSTYRVNSGLLSPPTVTLGDEFQTVLSDLPAAVAFILQMQDYLFRQTKRAFEIRYVIVEGAIDTPINPEIAHGMMGPGLTRARELLNEKKRRHVRLELDDSLQEQLLGDLFEVMHNIERQWSVDDAELIQHMRASSDSETAKTVGKDRSQIWRRRRTLMIEDHRRLVDAVKSIAGGMQMDGAST